MLDILTLTNGSATIKDPFTIANTHYIKNINGKTDCFLNNTEPQENPDNPELVDHFLTVTLLPRQIIIFPKTIYPNMDTSVLGEMKYYDDLELR